MRGVVERGAATPVVADVVFGACVAVGLLAAAVAELGPGTWARPDPRSLWRQAPGRLARNFPASSAWLFRFKAGSVALGCRQTRGQQLVFVNGPRLKAASSPLPCAKVITPLSCADNFRLRSCSSIWTRAR